ncbi:hypothetical protein F4779DRAFT_633847 [Xylariaceae sp. FL0662B]|nr:hypothetical protein F4779DRAFT_633847 [Xylariaceae sp. FL0662B]
MHSSPVARFVSNQDLLYCLGDQVHNRQLLADLCLTCKEFNEIFSLFFYRELWFCERNSHWLLEPDKRNLLLENYRLKHVRNLSFSVYADIDEEDHFGTQDEIIHFPSSLCQTPQACEAFNEGITKLLCRMPRLKEFTWLGYPLFSETLWTLYSSCEDLLGLILIYPANLEQRLGGKVTKFRNQILCPQVNVWEPLRSRWEAPDLPPFRNLEKLHLHNLWSREQCKWRKMIVDVLIGSPQIRDLGLSMASATRWRNMDPAWHQDSAQRHPAHFLPELCREYRNANGKPLKVHTLHLGHYMYILRPGLSSHRIRPQFQEEYENGGCLDSLVVTSQIQELTMDLVDDRGFGGPIPAEFGSGVGLLWWPTAPGKLSKLRKLTLRKPNVWFVRWLNRLTRETGPLMECKLNEAYQQDDFLYEYVPLATLAAKWYELLECRPRALLVHNHSSGPRTSDAIIYCDTIRDLAIQSLEFQAHVLGYVSRMPGLENLWIIPEHFDFIGPGQYRKISQQRSKGVATAGQLASLGTALKHFRFGSITWRIERTGSSFILHEMDRMENETEIPELFRISVPYSLNEAHAMKYWVKNRPRDLHEMV